MAQAPFDLLRSLELCLMSLGSFSFCLATLATLFLVVATAFTMTSPATTSASLLSSAAVAFLKSSTSSNKNGEWVVEESFDVTRELVAKGFAGNETVAGEPSFEWVMQYFDGITPDKKLQTVGFFMSLYVSEQMRKKNSFIFAKKRNDELVSVVLVREYDVATETHWWNKCKDKVLEPVSFMRIAWTDGFPPPFKDEQLKATGQTAVTVFENMDKLWKRMHHELMLDKHWYFSVVATDPACQGQGLCSEIMTRLTELADDAKVGCYLECNSEKNQRFYEKFGFVMKESGQTENLFDTKSPPCTTYFMVRSQKST